MWETYKEFTEDMFTKYPLLYADKDKSMMESLVCFGFDGIGKGWFTIIDRLSNNLEEYIKTSIKEGYYTEENYPRAFQMKEKWGTLRFYITDWDEYMERLIDAAEDETETTCMICGSKEGILRTGGWYVVRCNKCHEEYIQKCKL